jgi:hypothetical protein
MTGEINYEETLEYIKDLNDQLVAKLPTSIERLSISLHAKLPFKAMSLRAILMYRVSELSKSAYQQYEARSLISAFVLSRAVVETGALLCSLLKSMRRVVSEQQVGDVDDFLMKALFGQRTPDSNLAALNVLTLIDHMDKESRGVRSLYDFLSEYAHPNYSGSYGAYGSEDRENYCLNLGADFERINWKPAISTHLVAIREFMKSCEEVSDLLPDFTIVCEADLARKGII